MSTPYKNRALDSPSRQLLWELNQLAISSQEGFYAHLDKESEHREDLHREALAAAARRHERVRQNAEVEKQRLREEQDAEERRQEEEQRTSLEGQRREKELAEQHQKKEQARLAEKHRRELVEIERETDEIERQAKAEKAKEDAENAQKIQNRELAEKKQQDNRAAEAKAKDDAVAALRKQAEPNPTSITPAPQPIPQTTLQQAATQSAKNTQWELDHRRYLEIHQQLKDLRKYMTKTAKERSELKDVLGNMRREIKKSVGQLIEGRGSNTKPLRTIIDILKRALTLPEPQVNITLFLAHAPAPMPPDPNGPALMVYLLNEFSKSIIAQFIDEAGVSPKRADAIGVVASHIFALDFFRWKGISLIDILLAKLHVVAPALFGIYGAEGTVQGKERLGWWREDGRSEGPFLSEQQHFVRMTGLAAGFAAISLRNYEKAKVENPFPERHYWEALAKITNVPPAEITQTHFVLLKALVENYETKFIGFYGGAAVAALREALIELPARCPASIASKSLAGLKEVLAREKRLFL